MFCFITEKGREGREDLIMVEPAGPAWEILVEILPFVNCLRYIHNQHSTPFAVSKRGEMLATKVLQSASRQE